MNGDDIPDAWTPPQSQNPLLNPCKESGRMIGNPPRRPPNIIRPTFVRTDIHNFMDIVHQCTGAESIPSSTTSSAAAAAVTTTTAGNYMGTDVNESARKRPRNLVSDSSMPPFNPLPSSPGYFRPQYNPLPSFTSPAQLFPSGAVQFPPPSNPFPSPSPTFYYLPNGDRGR